MFERERSRSIVAEPARSRTASQSSPLRRSRTASRRSSSTPAAWRPVRGIRRGRSRRRCGRRRRSARSPGRGRAPRPVPARRGRGRPASPRCGRSRSPAASASARGRAPPAAPRLRPWSSTARRGRARSGGGGAQAPERQGRLAAGRQHHLRAPAPRLGEDRLRPPPASPATRAARSRRGPARRAAGERPRARREARQHDARRCSGSGLSRAVAMSAGSGSIGSRAAMIEATSSAGSLCSGPSRSEAKGRRSRSFPLLDQDRLAIAGGGDEQNHGRAGLCQPAQQALAVDQSGARSRREVDPSTGPTLAADAVPGGRRSSPS